METIVFGEIFLTSLIVTQLVYYLGPPMRPHRALIAAPIVAPIAALLAHFDALHGVIIHILLCSITPALVALLLTFTDNYVPSERPPLRPIDALRACTVVSLIWALIAARICFNAPALVDELTYPGLLIGAPLMVLLVFLIAALGFYALYTFNKRQ